MKKKVSIMLVLSICFCLAACGAAASNSAATPTAQPAAAETLAAAETPAASPDTAVPAAAEMSSNHAELQSMVDSLNAEENAQRTEDDPSVGIFELGKEPNTIIYKLSMQYFQYVVMMAQAGDQEHMNAYNRTVEYLPPVEVNLENALHESMPELNVLVYMMEDEYSSNVIAVVDNGEIVYDSVNGVGTAPEDVAPIVLLEDLPPEAREQIEDVTNALVIMKEVQAQEQAQAQAQAQAQEQEQAQPQAQN